MLKPVKGTLVFNSDLLDSKSIGYLPQISTGDVNYPVTVMDIVLSGLMIKKGIITRMSSSDRKKASIVLDELGLVRDEGCNTQ